MDSVLELIQFVGHISSVGLQFESSSTLLLRFILDFYETVYQLVDTCFVFSPAPVFLLKCVSDQLLPSFLYLQTGVWHVPQIWTSFNCDAASWCFLSSSVFHWPRQRGSSGLHHVQVRTPCCFCCLKINVYLSWWILLQHYDMNIIIGFITWFKKHRTSSNWSDLFLTV